MSILLVLSMILTILNSDILLTAHADEAFIYGNVVAGGNGYSLFIDENSDLYSYGSNEYGQLGNGTNDYCTKPEIVMNDVRTVFSGKDHVLIIDSSDNLYAVGRNNYSQLGDGGADDCSDPVLIMSDVKTACAGDSYSLVVTKSGTLYAFGKNDVGQLGLKASEIVHDPTVVMENVSSVSAGVNHSFVVTEDGLLYGFGSNEYHKINSSDVHYFDSPVELMKDVRSVSAGATHSMVLKTDLKLYGFGNNALNQISDKLLYVVEKPSFIMDGVIDVKAGFTGNIVKKSSGEVSVFGNFFNSAEGNIFQDSIDFPVANIEIGFNDSVYVVKPDGKLLEYSFRNKEFIKLLRNSAFGEEYTSGGNYIDYKAAKKLYDRGLFNGVRMDEFEPMLTKKASAIEAIVIIGRAFHWEVDDDIKETEFADVPVWAAPYVRYAVDHAITSGVGNGLFGADLISGKRIFTWLVTQLGEDKAAVWKNPEIYEEKYSLLVPKSSFRSDLAGIVYQVVLIDDANRVSVNREVVDALKNKVIKKDAAVLLMEKISDNILYDVEARLLFIKSKTLSLEEEYKNRKLIAITFDDGPSKHTKRLLDALKKYEARSTFFVLGSCASLYPEYLVRMKNEGHEIANHSYIHPDLSRMSWGNVLGQIDSCDSVIRNATGLETTLLRPPYGAYNATVKNICRQKNMSIIMWDIDTRDWQYKDRAYVKRYLIMHAREGSIVLLHDLHSTSVDGFIDALPTLVEKGYHLVTVTELMKHYKKDLVPGEVYRSAR